MKVGEVMLLELENEWKVVDVWELSWKEKKWKERKKKWSCISSMCWERKKEKARWKKRKEKEKKRNKEPRKREKIYKKSSWKKYKESAWICARCDLYYLMGLSRIVDIWWSWRLSVECWCWEDLRKWCLGSSLISRIFFAPHDQIYSRPNFLVLCPIISH